MSLRVCVCVCVCVCRAGVRSTESTVLLHTEMLNDIALHASSHTYTYTHTHTHTQTHTPPLLGARRWGQAPLQSRRGGEVGGGGVCPPALLPFVLRAAGTSQSNLVLLWDYPATHTHTHTQTHIHTHTCCICTCTYLFLCLIN